MQNIRILGILLIGLVGGGCYLTQNAGEYLTHHTEAVPFEQVYANRALTILFQRIAAIRSFGIDVLDLNRTKSYTKYVKTDKSYLVDVVSAVKADSFERHTWWYPIFGRLPYRGYYTLAHAEKEAERLRSQGYDVYVRRVDAFSSHGYFPELVYTYMAGYTEYHLAELVLHELAHSKLWLRSKTQFNEEFASFVGSMGAKQYMQDTHGINASIIAEHDAFVRDYERFLNIIASLREELEEVYSSSLGSTAKISEKERIITRFKQNYKKNYSDTFETENFSGLPDIEINNAFIDLYHIYYGNAAAFLEAHARLGGSLAETINAISAFKKLDSKDFDPYAALEQLGRTTPPEDDQTDK